MMKMITLNCGQIKTALKATQCAARGSRRLVQLEKAPELQHAAAVDARVHVLAARARALGRGGGDRDGCGVDLRAALPDLTARERCLAARTKE